MLNIGLGVVAALFGVAGFVFTASSGHALARGERPASNITAIGGAICIAACAIFWRMA